MDLDAYYVFARYYTIFMSDGTTHRASITKHTNAPSEMFRFHFVVVGVVHLGRFNPIILITSVGQRKKNPTKDGRKGFGKPKRRKAHIPNEEHLRLLLHVRESSDFRSILFIFNNKKSGGKKMRLPRSFMLRSPLLAHFEPCIEHRHTSRSAHTLHTGTHMYSQRVVRRTRVKLRKLLRFEWSSRSNSKTFSDYWI